MNFSADGLETAAARREEAHAARVHYTNEFQIYQKQRPNGAGVTKRARCNHCQGDWAYNETRLKNHIIDPYRGCRRIPQEARDRVRATDTTNNNPVTVATTAPLTTHPQPPPSAPPTKRKRETVLAVSAPSLHAQTPVVPVSAETPDLLVGIGSTAEATQSAPMRVTVEFSMASGTLLRATWIASELLTEFHRDIGDLTLVPKSSENTFNLWIGGKIVWSRGVGQPLPDYEHLRPIVRAQCCNATL